MHGWSYKVMAVREGGQSLHCNVSEEGLALEVHGASPVMLRHYHYNIENRYSDACLLVKKELVVFSWQSRGATLSSLQQN